MGGTAIVADKQGRSRKQRFNLSERSAGDALVIAELGEALAGSGNEDRLEVACKIFRHFLEVCSRPGFVGRRSNGMNYGKWGGSRCGRCEQLRAGDFPDWDAEEKNCARQMLRGVDLAMDLQNLLRGWDSNVIERAETKMSETGPEARPRRERQLRAAVATVKIHYQFRMQTGDLGGAGRQSVFDVRIAFEERRKASSTTTASFRSGRAHFNK